MRTKKAVKNVIIAVGGQIFSVLIGLVTRSIFVSNLAEVYLGMNGLFSEILAVLSLIELGVGPAMTYSLYKPLSDNDTEKIKSLMVLYKKIYRFVGIAIITMGICLLPFYRILIKNPPALKELDIIFMIYILNTGCSYFFSYKRSLIVSDQKRYIERAYYYGFDLLLNIVQCVILILTHNFILFLLAQFFLIFIRNWCLSVKAEKLYPYLKDKNVKSLTKEESDPIKKNVYALMIHRLGTTLVSSTDNLILSKVIGLGAVGLYSNYNLIIKSLNRVIVQMFRSIIASVGNAAIEVDKVKLTDIFEKIMFISFWLYGFCACCLYSLFNPFVVMWLGKRFLLPDITVAILVVNFYISGMRRPPILFRDATGNYYADRYKAILAAIVNLVVSIVLANKIGMTGVFIGTTVCMVSTYVWMEPLIIYKKCLAKPLSSYFANYGIYGAATIAACAVTKLLCSLILHGGIFPFVLKMLVCAITPNVVFAALFFRRREFKFFLKLIGKKAAEIRIKLKHGKTKENDNRE